MKIIHRNCNKFFGMFKKGRRKSINTYPLCWVRPAWAKDANGKDIKTNYIIDGNELIQKVEFNNESAFPIVADPTTSRKPSNKYIGEYSYDLVINHSDYALFSWGAGTIKVFLEKEIKKKIMSKLGSYVMGLGYIDWALSGYCTIASSKYFKKNHTKFTIHYKKYLKYVYRRGWTGINSYQMTSPYVNNLKIY